VVHVRDAGRGRAEHPRGADRWPPGTVAGLVFVVTAAWAAVVVDRGHMHPDVPGFVAAWTLMMAAMMVPSATPLVLLYRKAASPWRTARLVTGYLIVWVLAGAGALVIDRVGGGLPR
jgi:predicted metal-binding membrane protein